MDEPLDAQEQQISDPLVDGKGVLFRRAVRGGGWLMALRIVSQGLDFAKLLVLAWILGRAKWGLLGIALLTLTTLQVFTQTGFHAAFIHKRTMDRGYLDTLWSVGLLRGALLFCIMILGAPLAIRFFDGSGRFEPQHFERVGHFAQMLRQGEDALSSYLFERLSPGALALLDEAAPDGPPPVALRQLLADDFNRIVTGPSLYAPDRFAHVSLSSFARSLAEQPHRADVVRLNRRLLQEAYPQFIEETVLDRTTGVAVLRLLALILIFGALSNPGVICFRKDLDFRKDFVFESVSSLAAALTTIVLAFVMRSVWALVYGRLLGAVLRCLISYRVHPFRPKFVVDRAKAAELWRYGKWIFLTTVLGYFQNYGDNLFVAKYLGPTALGMYVLAYRLSQLPATEITLLLGGLLFPAYSKLQHDRPRLRQAYLKVLSVTAVVSIPTAGLIFLLAPDFVHTFLTPEWRPVIPVLQVLAVKGLTHSLHATFGAVYQAVGLPGITTKLQVIRVVLLCLLIYPLTARWGVVGTALTVVLIGLIMQPFGYGILIRVIHCRVREVLIRIVYPLVATLAMLLAAVIVRGLVFQRYSMQSLVALGAFAVGVYVLVIGVADRWAGYSIVASVREMVVAALSGKAAPAKPRRSP